MLNKVTPCAWIPGHSYRLPWGARIKGMLPEYYYNREIVTAAAQDAMDTGFYDYVVIDNPAAQTPQAIIKSQLDQVHSLNCPFGLEIHLNSYEDPQVNYGAAFYRKDCRVSKRLAERVKKTLYPRLQYNIGLTSFKVVSLPDPQWTRLLAVMNATVPYVLIEPFFLSSDLVQGAINRYDVLQDTGRAISALSQHFYAEVTNERQ